MDQSDTIGKIELIPLSVLSSVITNYKNDIQQISQLFDELRVNSHIQVLVVHQTVEWHFTH